MRGICRRSKIKMKSLDIIDLTGKKESEILVNSGALINARDKNELLIGVDFIKNPIVANTDTERVVFSFDLDSAPWELFSSKALCCYNYPFGQIFWKDTYKFISFPGEFNREHDYIPNFFFTSESFTVRPFLRSSLASLSAFSSSAESSA